MEIGVSSCFWNLKMAGAAKSAPARTCRRLHARRSGTEWHCKIDATGTYLDLHAHYHCT
jgi:hypothetical protein